MEYTPSFTETLEVTGPSDEYADPFPEKIVTDRLRFEPLTDAVDPSDMFELYKRNSGTDRWFNTTMGLPETYQQARDLFESIDDLRAACDDMFYVLFERDSNEIVGQATIEDVDFHAGRCGIGIWLRKDQWGKGFSQERAEGLLYAIFTELEIDTVEIRVATENTPSIKAVEKYLSEFGGQYEGCLRNISPTPQLDIIDMYAWSITAEEFFDDDASYKRSPKPLPSDNEK